MAFRYSRNRGASPIIKNSKTTPSSDGFKTFSLEPRVLRGVEAAGFQAPRPIQAQAMPAVLAGRDVLGLAQTGTGKTAAFALPILSRFAAQGNSRGASPRALILAPTRELATQIEREINQLGHFTNVRSTVVYGGMPIARQVRALKKRPDILVACPGRLLDLYQRRELDLRGVELLVLDEADHMFDMGFLPDIRRILGALPARRQNLLFSATMPREIRSLTDNLLRDPHVVELAHSAPAETIEHALYPCTDGFKQDLLKHLLDEPDFSSAIVFLRTKSRAKRLAERLVRDGRQAVALQGNMSQSQRDRAMHGFRQGRYKVLVATDIAARGLDVEGVSHVINFDVPNTPDAYTHRIGRTGRSERPGKACTFVTGQDRAQVRAIEARIGAEIPCVRLAAFGAIEPTRRKKAPARPGSRAGAGNGRPHGQDEGGPWKGKAHGQGDGDRGPWKGKAHAQGDGGPWKGKPSVGRAGKRRVVGPERGPRSTTKAVGAAQTAANNSWQAGKGWDQPSSDLLDAGHGGQSGQNAGGPSVGRRARRRIRRSQPDAAVAEDRGAGAWGKPGARRGQNASGGSKGNAKRGRSVPGRGRSAHARDRSGF